MILRRKQLGYIATPRLGIGRREAAGGDPHFANVVLLALNESGADGSTSFDDASSSGHTITPSGGAQWDTAQFPTGLMSSGLLDGTGDYWTVNGHSDFNFGTGDFTVEFFLRTGRSARQDLFTGNLPNGNVDNAYTIISGLSSADELQLYEKFTLRINGTYALDDSAWHHIALSRDGNSVRLFADGTQVGSTYTTGFSYGNDTNQLGIGFLTDGNAVNGHMASVRLTKGVARYAGAFTPPSLPLPTS